MEKDFVPYEQAIALKELGFDRSCLGWYNSERSALSVGESWRSGQNSIIAPLYQQAFRFFREKYDLVYFITPEGSIKNRCYLYSIKDYKAFVGTFGQTYEEAEFNCLKNLIEIAQNK